MLELPNNLTAYKRTPQFDNASLPAGFLKDHSTKAGTWGVLTIEHGVIEYVVTEPGYESEHLLTTDLPGIIAPQHTHYICPKGEVSFYLTFYR